MVDSLVSTVVNKLTTTIPGQVALFVDVPSDINKLSSAFTDIRDVLKDAESPRCANNRLVKIWLEKVKDVAYDVDDILDEWSTEEAHRPQAPDEGDGSCFSFLGICFFPYVTLFNHFKFRYEIGCRIKKVRGRLDSIKTEISNLGLEVNSGEREGMDRPGEMKARETSSLIDEQLIVGRDDEKKLVVDWLVGGSSGEVNVPLVISIVGMGGLGKTTLAQLTYNDEKVKEHFRMKMWVYVSKDFDVKQITISIIKSVDTDFNVKNLNLDQLQIQLRKMLHDKIFLLVLDDIWSDESEKWNKLKLPFQTGASGSRIIITTRSENVAMAMGSARIHKLAVLSNDECWLLFRRSAPKDPSAEVPSELEGIGKQILNKLGGLPLAVRTVGSVMYSNMTTEAWELVLDKIGKSRDVPGGVLPALLLSYHDLPPVLKQCFAFFSIFPKGFKIEKNMMVELWAAQGFIGSDTSSNMEKSGGLYFDDLLRRSLLQVVELDEAKNVLKCKMHDLVHDLAQSVAGSDFSLVQIGKQASLVQNGKQASLNFNNLRHSSFVSDITVNEADEVAYISANLYKAHKLRTLFLGSRISVVPRMSFHHWRRLRALNLSYTSIEKLSPTVGHLKHLRFLDLSRTDVEELPEEVCNCLNLQTLRLNDCQKLKKLPGGMKKMINLRHLEFAFCPSLNYLPQGIERLTGLRTLTKFIVGSGNEGCKWGELNLLNHLQGRLQIIGLENISSTVEAMKADLNKKLLHGLCFSYDDTKYYQSPFDEEVKRREEVLEILQPHTNLKKLEILDYPGSKLPKWIEDPMFSNLVSIKLSGCWECKQLPGLGKLPSLKHLFIWGIYAMRKVGVEFTGVDNNDGSGLVVSFPRLETLVFDTINFWQEWELRGGDGKVMPSLLQLEILRCGLLRKLPSNLPPLLQKLTIQMRGGMDPWFGSSPAFHPNLKHLIIEKSCNMESFPCDWLGQFKALKTLEIKHCKDLESLPDEELQQLTMLQELKIYFCPLLYKRYGEKGEDRHKIARIPKITFRV